MLYNHDIVFDMRGCWHLACGRGHGRDCELDYVDGLAQNCSGLVQDCSNSIATALELLQSCTEPSMCCHLSDATGCSVRKSQGELERQQSDMDWNIKWIP